MPGEIAKAVGITNPGVWSGSGGNPELKPWLADAYDISVERYFGKRSFISLAYYKKKLHTYIYNQNVPTFDFTGYPITPVNALSPATGLVTPTAVYCSAFVGTSAVCQTYSAGNRGSFTQPINGRGGNADGVEAAVTLDGGLIASFLDGFGVQASYSKRWTDIRPNGPGTSQVLPGFSGSNRNVTLFYEKYGFSARVSERVRDTYRGEVTGLFSTRSFTQILEDKQLDAQLSYEFQDGPAKGLTLLLQGNNLTDSPYRTRLGGTFPGGATQPQDYDTYGKQILFGLNWKM